MFMAFMVVMVSLVYTHPSSHRLSYFKYIQLFTCHAYYNKVGFCFVLFFFLMDKVQKQCPLQPLQPQAPALGLKL